MSELQKDTDVLGKRTNTLETEESLRDQLDNDLYDKVDDLDAAKIVNNLWSSAMSDRTDWLNKQEEYLADYDEFVNIEPSGLFETSSNLRVPMTLWTVKTYHARFLQTLVSPEPSLSVKARRSEYQDVEQDIEEFLKYTLVEWVNNYKGIEETLDQWVWSWITTGVGYLKNSWDKRYQRYVDVVEREVEGPVKFVVDPITGNEIEQQTTVMQESIVEKVKKVFDGPAVDFIKSEDLAVISQDITDVDGADAVIHRHWLTASELWTLVDRGIFDEQAVEDIINGGDVTKSGSMGGSVKQARVTNSGESTVDKAYDHDRYEILEGYISLDVDGSGINSEIIVWTDTKSRALLKASYLYRVFKNGHRPFSAISFHKRSGTNDHMPVGLVEMLHCIQKELDAIHNMRIDFGMLSTMPFGFYRASSSIDPQKIALEPGALIPVDNPADVIFPNLGNRTIFGMQEESQLYVMVERLTGISDLSLGSMSGRQGATRTATGTRALLAESNVNLDVPLKRLNRGWKRCLENLLDMLQQRTPRGFEYRVAGGEGFDRYMKILGDQDLAGDYGIEVSPTTSASNPQIRLENASQILQLTQNPLYIQMGVVTPQNMYEALANYMKVIGIKEVSKFINSGFADQYVLTPQEELTRVLGLSQPPVMPNADHEGFVALATDVLRNDERVGELNDAQVAAIQMQITKHNQMQQALQTQQAQQANVNQQIVNSQQAAIGPSSNPSAPVGDIGGQGE